MQIASILEDLKFDENNPKISLLLENNYSKEIRITFKKGQEMKEHKAPLPISVEVFRGEIEFIVKSGKVILKDGDIISLEANIFHSLNAKEESIVRLTLNKRDKIDRVSAILKS